MSKSIKKEEFIVCAAVRFVIKHLDQDDSGSSIIVPIVKTENEFHLKLIEEMIDCDKDVEIVSRCLGFSTSNGRFVDQKEALEITGWKNKLYFKDKDYLTPEDLLYFQSLIY